ncbi:Sad1/UNC domain-containing protein [Cordyceps fumosorosea ARSEF 2679]|uniref:Sad1/UNC domain-containing protein n=1 Tax=Cordyceps fumosorosea (strain ARSEF 2679) TaxID=1081104 RepID=A0A167MIX5_CORFA|nr:Sad1/UNC domain-containing protein [Cordyceps fumosorosea ARSEF 2679]OAA54409.1 Sad1/UNC domain-containing protein [Cordyceps fumosorosea ARSEF 2679]
MPHQQLVKRSDQHGKEDDSSTVAYAEPIETKNTTLKVNESSETADTDSTAEPFMSFEDWKEIMLQRTGQDPQDLKQRKGSDSQSDERQKLQSYSGSDLGDEGEISLNFGGYMEKPEAEHGYDGGKEHTNESPAEAGQSALRRNKDAGKTCKERFSFASFDAGATILKTSSGAKNSKAILVENKDTYMLLECATPNKYVIIELTDDIWVDTIVLANFEFFSSMIRHFRVSIYHGGNNVVFFFTCGRRRQKPSCFRLQ